MGGTEVALRPEVFRIHTLFRQDLQQRRFPRPIGAREEHDLARGQLEGDVPDQDAVAVADRQVVDLKYRRMYAVDCQCFM